MKPTKFATRPSTRSPLLPRPKGKDRSSGRAAQSALLTPIVTAAQGKTVREQQVENMQGIARVRLLLPHHGCTDLSRISDPEFVIMFSQHSLEPLGIEGSFYPDSGRTRKCGIKPLSFSVLVFQPALDDFAGCGIQHRNLLEARMEIASYNEHRSAPFLRALVDYHRQVYSVEGSPRRHLINLTGHSETGPLPFGPRRSGLGVDAGAAREYCCQHQREPLPPQTRIGGTS